MPAWRDPATLPAQFMQGLVQKAFEFMTKSKADLRLWLCVPCKDDSSYFHLCNRSSGMQAIRALTKMCKLLTPV